MFYLTEEVVNYIHRRGDNVLPHSHGGCEVIVYEGGSGVATVGREEFNYADRALLIVPERCEHFERTLTETKVRGCVFRTDYFRVEEPVMISSEKYYPLIGKIYEQLGGMAQIFLTEGDRAGARLENDLAQLLFSVRYLWEIHGSKFSSSSLSVCNNAKKYIQSNYGKKINFEILAENIGYSYDRFRHIFVEVVGMGPKAYLQGVRMSNAKKLLTATSRPVREIAAACGYRNPVCFMNYFKESMGLTPTQYRKLSRKEAKNKTFNFSDRE